MTVLESMLAACRKQQELQKKPDAMVTFFVPGKWPDSGRKKLLGRHGGPVGRCVAEFEDSILCEFQADVVVKFLEALHDRPL